MPRTPPARQLLSAPPGRRHQQLVCRAAAIGELGDWMLLEESMPYSLRCHLDRLLAVRAADLGITLIP